jgi:hypothetical protein
VKPMSRRIAVDTFQRARDAAAGKEIEGGRTSRFLGR